MALPPLTTVDELERRLGQTIPDGVQRERAEALLSDASTLVRSETGRTWVDAEGALTEIPDLAVTVTIAAALRGWFNPAAIESAQLGAVSIRYGDVWLTSTERERLTDMTQAGFQSVDMHHGYGWSETTVGWAPYQFNDSGPAPGDWFPIGY